MTFFRKFLSLVLALLLMMLPVRAHAASADTEDYVQRMIQYYLRFQEGADDEIAALLDHLTQTDPSQAEMWRKIMVSWAYNRSQMQIHQGILPDGLPEDDSLCIVIMGYGLNKDGSMKEELIDRLVVGLSSALKYPNAYIAVTGGATSDVKGVTEAGQMADWLQQRGIQPNRIIVEKKALSTTENAINVHGLLMKNYPQVNSLAVVTSDYHIRQSCTMFTTMSHKAACEDDARALKLVGNAVNTTNRKVNTLSTEGWGISLITGIPYDPSPETQPELCE